MINKFIQLEEEQGLLHHKVQHVKYWPHLRFSIYFDFVRQKNTISERYATHSKSPNKLKAIVKKIELFLYFFRNNPLRGLKQKDLLVFNHPRRVKNKDFYDCIYTDEFLKQVDSSYMVLERTLAKHAKPIRTENIKYLDYLEFISYIKIKFFRIFKKYYLTEQEKAEILNKFRVIERELRVKLEADKIIQNIQEIIWRNKALKSVYRKILREVAPKVIIEVVSYSPHNQIVNEVAREKGIPIIELQHGVMGRYHIAYNFYKKQTIESFPDYIFTYGDFWNGTTRLPIEEDKVISVGSYYFEQKVKEYQKTKAEDDKQQEILFISQLVIGAQLSKIATELAEKIDSEKYKIVYKLHPGEYKLWRSDYPHLVNDKIEVIDHNEKDIYYYLNKADVQIGSFSTAVFEGLGFGLKTYVVKTYGAEYMEELYNNGYITLVESAEEIAESLNNENIKFDDILDKLWKRNSMDNLKQALNRIIKT